MNLCKLFFCLWMASLVVGCHSNEKKTTTILDKAPQNNGPAEDTSATIKALEESFSQQPTVHNGLVLANLYAETKNERAITLCDAMLKKDSARELTDAVFIKGIYYANINKKERAIELFEECIKRDWKFIEAYIEKGIIQYDKADINGALKTFQLATKVSNTYPDGYYWTARCFEHLGQKQEAIDNYSRTLALDKDFTEAAEGIRRLN